MKTAGICAANGGTVRYVGTNAICGNMHTQGGGVQVGHIGKGRDSSTRFQEIQNRQQATYSGTPSGTPSPLMPVLGNPLGIPTASPRGPLGRTAARISVRTTATACPLDQHPVRAAPGGSEGHRGALRQRQAGGAGQLGTGESEALARMLYGGAPVAAGVERWTMHAKQS